MFASAQNPNNMMGYWFLKTFGHIQPYNSAAETKGRKLKMFVFGRKFRPLVYHCVCGSIFNETDVSTELTHRGIHLKSMYNLETMKIWIRLHIIFHHKATNFSSVVWEWETDVDKIVVDCRGAGRVTKARNFLISNITHCNWGLARFYFIHFMGIERIFFFYLADLNVMILKSKDCFEIKYVLAIMFLIITFLFY